ncbi:flagellar basal body-associated protein FliL [Alkalihalophilus marmarensis]|uniref:flagellar basal body-associated protein FliL n=1 Tax=Alkalihalophilus marmarensis TaxID=521377 RepID=UPI002DBA0487|nr:flagellar basal body-associated protein FliL [Alkalihalophilus marmarensis]MEC2073114.1 flagellar basal body-associated protein FliL [Alkalihalophilus marmarensis]
MFKNKLINIMLIILIALTLIGVITLVLFNHFTNQPDANAEPTIDEIIAQSYVTEEITTNLLSNDFVRTQFHIHVDSKKALQEIQKRDFQVENIILRTLSGKKSPDLAGSAGIEELEAEIKEQINQLLQEGSVVQVYTTSWVIQ